MPLIWTAEYSVGDPLLDAQHRRLFEIIEQLRTLLDGRGETSDILALLEGLEAYATLHFHHEEARLKRLDYVDLQAQVQEHRRFSVKLSHRAARIRAGDVNQGAALLRWLIDWWGMHVLVSDRKYAARLAAGAGQSPKEDA